MLPEDLHCSVDKMLLKDLLHQKEFIELFAKMTAPPVQVAQTIGSPWTLRQYGRMHSIIHSFIHSCNLQPSLCYSRSPRTGTIKISNAVHMIKIKIVSILSN